MDIDWKVHENMKDTKSKSFQFSKVLGHGSFAVVYQASDSRNGDLVAIKVLPKKQLKANYKLDELVQTEIRVLKLISKSQNKNQNVVRYIDQFLTDRSLCIVMEYCNGGDLSQYLDKKKRLTEDEATDILKQILNGFRGLHEANAMHRDFKAANILIHQGMYKIADLGFAKQLAKDQMTKTVLGTDLTKAPQVLQMRSYGMQTDIWSLGVVYYQLIYGCYPYNGFNEGNILQKIKAGPPYFKSVNISPQAFDFISRCLTVDPKKRIKWSQIYEHPLINNVNKAIYGLNSAIFVNDNKNFYKQGVQVPSNFLDIKCIQVSDIDFIETAPMQSAEISGLVKRNQNRKLQDLGVNGYQKAYLSRRNNIMFIFTYVTPHIINLMEVSVNHDSSLFILAKKAYHDMLQFKTQIENKQDFLKLNGFFKQFVASPSYKEIATKIKRDTELVRDQVKHYSVDITKSNNAVSQELEFNQIQNANWLQFVQDTIDGYQYELGNHLDVIKQDTIKRDVVSVIQALRYYRQHIKNAETEEFARKLADLNYEKAEKQIVKRLSSRFDDDYE